MAWGLVLSIYVFVGAFPGFGTTGGTLLDGEWVLEVNRLAWRTFGRDVAFTYGPLAFLLYPALTAGHVVVAIVLRALVMAGLAVAVWSGTTWTDRVLFALAQVLAVGLGLGFEYQVLVPALLLATRWSSGHCGARSAGPVLGLLAGILLFAKFSLGSALATLLASSWLALVRRQGHEAFRHILGSGLAALGTVLVAGSILLAAPTDLLPWILRSLELAGGYSASMSLDSRVAFQAAHALAAAGTLLLLLLLGSWGLVRPTPARVLVLISVGPAFMAFKHAFVRQDVWHTTLFFPFVLAVTATAALLAQDRRERLLFRSLVAMSAAFSFAVASSYNLVDVPGSSLRRSLSGADGLAAIRGWFSFDARQHALARTLATFTPPGLAAAVGGRHLGVVPFRLGPCAEAGISCRPNPTLQTFAAFTSSLDHWSADHFAGGMGPPLVLVHLDGFDGRTPPLDTPALWRSLVSNYQATSYQAGSMLLLERRPTAIRGAPEAFGQIHVEAERWVALPDVAGPRYASISLNLTWLGRLRKTLFRVGPVFLLLRYDTGEVAEFRIVPDTARDGLPVDEVPLHPGQLRGLFEGRGSRRPVHLALRGEGLASYQSPFLVSWSRARPAGPVR